MIVIIIVSIIAIIIVVITVILEVFQPTARYLLGVSRPSSEGQLALTS